MRVRVRKKILAMAAVSMKTALKYRRNWNKHGPAVKLLQSLMPTDGKTKKGYRLYMDIGHNHKARYNVPAAVRVALKREGFVVTDYLAKKCAKISDKEQKNEYNIGKVIAKDVHAKMAFDNDPQLQNSKTDKFQVVISCHPYDIIGMSTGRDWDKQSCMRLDDGVRNKNDAGAYHRHVKNDVAEGTLVAYAIRADDTNIQKPLVRCLLKPFKSEDSEEVLYRRESRVYGNNVPGFSAVLSKFLRQINAHVPSGFYKMVSGLYDDGAGTRTKHDADVDESGAILDDDSSNLVDFVRHKAEGLKKDPTEITYARAILDGIQGSMRQNATTVSESDMVEIADMIKGNEKVKEVFTDAMMAVGLDHYSAKIGRLANFFDEYSAPNETVAKAMGKFPNSILSRMAQSGGVALKMYMEKLEAIGADSEAEYNHRTYEDAYNFVRGVLTGVYPVPTKEEMQTVPNVASTLYTMASAARFIVLADQQIGSIEHRLLTQAHDVVHELEGTPKVVDENAIEFAFRVGYTSLYAGFLLDNDQSSDLTADVVFRQTPYELVQGVFGHRRVFRALTRSKNHNIQYLMDQVKYEIFKSCISDPLLQQKFKPVLPEAKAYMLENTEFFHEIQWDTRMITNLARLDPMLLQHVTETGPPSTFADQIYDVVRRLIPILDEYKGPKIPVEQSTTMETVFRLCVAAGRIMDPVVSLSSKFEMEDVPLDEFYDWYNENKAQRMPKLTGVFRYVSYGVFMTKHQEVPTLQMSHVMDMVVKDAAQGFPGGFAGFTAPDIIRNHRAILKAIKTLPTVDKAAMALSSFVESIEMEETTSESEGAESLVDDGEMGYQLNDEDDDYYERREELLEQARTLIENRNSKIVDRNSQLLRIAFRILSDVGRGDEEDADPDEQLREYFDNYPEDDIEENMGELESMADDIYNHVMNIADSEREFKETAGYD